MPLQRPFGGSYTSPPPSAFSTAFLATENPISEGGAWRTAVNFYKAPQTTPGKCFANGTTDSYDDALMQLVSPDMGNDYRLSAHVFRQAAYSPGVSHEVGLYARMLINNSNPANTLVRGYEFLFPYNSTSFQIVKWIALDHSFDNFVFLSPDEQNGGLQPVADGDFLEVRVFGNDFEVYQNGGLIYLLTDSSYPTGGGPGFGAYVNAGATPANYCITDFAVQRL